MAAIRFFEFLHRCLMWEAQRSAPPQPAGWMGELLREGIGSPGEGTERSGEPPPDVLPGKRE